MGEIDFDACVQHDLKSNKNGGFTWHCDDCFNNALQEHDCKEYYLPNTVECELCWLANK